MHSACEEFLLYDTKNVSKLMSFEIENGIQ